MSTGTPFESRNSVTLEDPIATDEFIGHERHNERYNNNEQLLTPLQMMTRVPPPTLFIVQSKELNFRINPFFMKERIHYIELYWTEGTIRFFSLHPYY